MTIFQVIALYSISILFGTLFGNFATTFIHRIPLGKKIFGRKRSGGLPPHCAACGTTLGFSEYLPIIGLIKTRGKCLHCGAKIPKIYPITELYGAFAGAFSYAIVGFNYLFIIILLILVIVYSAVIITLFKMRLKRS